MTLRSRAVAWLLLAGAVVLHLRTVAFDFVLDDGYQIHANPAVRDGVPLSRFFLDASTTTSREDYNQRIYRPLRNVVFRAIGVTFGFAPLPFRCATVLLYAGCAALVYLLLARLLGDGAPARGAALLWVVLPVHVEVAAYPSALGDGLSGLLGLAGLHVALSAAGATPWRAVLAGAASLLLAFGAMAAKEMAVTQPALLFLVLFMFGRWSRRAAGLVGATALVSLGFLALRASVIGRIGQEDSTLASLGEGLLTAPVALVGYLVLTVAPLGHRLSYLKPDISWPLALGCLVAIAGILTVTFRAERDRAPRPALFGWLFFGAALLPVLHLVPSWAFLADRFVLTGSIGLMFVVAGLLAAAGRRGLRTWPLLALTLAIYTGGTLLEQEKWRDNAALFTHDVESEPNAPMAQSNYCSLLFERGDPAAALAACQRAVELGMHRAAEHLRMAVALEALGRLPEAEQAARTAITLEPDSAAAYAALGNLRLRAGDLPEAERLLVLAEARPPHVNVLLLRAELAVARGQREAAFRAYEQILRETGRVARMHLLYARAAARLGDGARSHALARRCLELDAGAEPCRELLTAAPPSPVTPPGARE